jgi:hypothetical protein
MIFAPESCNRPKSFEHLLLLMRDLAHPGARPFPWCELRDVAEKDGQRAGWAPAGSAEVYCPPWRPMICRPSNCFMASGLDEEEPARAVAADA